MTADVECSPLARHTPNAGRTRPAPIEALPNYAETARRRLARLASGRRRRHQAVAARLQLPAPQAPGEVEAVLAGHAVAAEAALRGDDAGAALALAVLSSRLDANGLLAAL